MFLNIFLLITGLLNTQNECNLSSKDKSIYVVILRSVGRPKVRGSDDLRI